MKNMHKLSLIDKKYRPNYEKEIIATYYLESDLPFAKAAQEIAIESSIGTWTDLSTLKPSVAKKLGPTVFYLNEKINLVKIAYPLGLFELGNLPQMLSALAGNIFGMKPIKNLRLEDIEMPRKYLKSFSGPCFGIDGVRKVLKIKNCPVLGSIIKPKVGLTSTEQADLAYNLWLNGIDVIKDDENLTSQTFNKFEDRARKVIKLRKKVEKQTGKEKFYIFNITGAPDQMLKRAKLVKKLGGKCVMIDIIITGLDNVDYLRRQNLGLILHGHRAGHAAFTRNPKHGISMLVIAKLARMVGIDELHTGTVVGKMQGSREEVVNINKALKEDWQHFHFLKEDWHGIKPTMPIASGGLHPGHLEKLVKILGQDLIINFGGGLHGHPKGSAAGAKACRQGIKLVSEMKSFKKNSKENPELFEALKYWG